MHRLACKPAVQAWTAHLSLRCSCSYCWALVHSRQEKEVKQGLAWAETLLSDPELPRHRQHECCYYTVSSCVLMSPCLCGLH